MTAIDNYLKSDKPDRDAETVCKQVRQIAHAIEKTLDLLDKQVRAYGETALEEEIGREAYAELVQLHAQLSSASAAYKNNTLRVPLGQGSSKRPLEEVKADLVAKLLAHSEEKISVTVTAQVGEHELCVDEKTRDFWGNQAAALALGIPFRPFVVRAITGKPVAIETQEMFVSALGSIQAAAFMEKELANAVCDRVMEADSEFRAQNEAAHYLAT